MGNSLGSATVCSTCGASLSAKAGCVACHIRAGLDEADEARASRVLFGDFEIERREDGSLCELGRGAMGVTYRAVDKVLHRSVALKVIELPAAASDSHAVRERFLREARAAAALRHPNVAGVFQFGALPEADRCYCAMELVEGETLKEFVRRNGPLEAELALDIGIQVTRALVAAAERGLVHRDLKPSNIMLTRGEAAAPNMQVKVIDFGLAKAAAAEGEEMELTHGGFVGTPAFASPEQFAGEQVDARSDIYAFGVTFWFALTGRLPHAGRTIDEIRDRRTRDELPLEQLRSRKVPERLVLLLRSCIALDPAQRPGSAHQLLQALESYREALVTRRSRRKLALFAAVAAVVATALGGYVVSQQTRATGRTDAAPDALAPLPQKSIAVLPFKPLVGGKSDPVLELGMADTLISKLSNSREIIVAPLGAVRKHGAIDADPLAAGRTLNVKVVLDGTILHVGDSLRLTARLLDVADGSSLWADTFHEKFTDIFAVQDTIAQKVAEALALRLTVEEKKQIVQRHTENVVAYQLYLTGRYHWSNLSPPEIQKSIGFFQQAIEIDPNYALAYFGLANAYQSASINSDTRPKEVMPQARAAALKAVELDESLAEPHFVLAMIHQFYDWDWLAAEKEAKRAIELNPNLASAHMAYAHLLSNVGRHEEAIAAAARAREIEPVSFIINALEGARLHYAGRKEEAEARLLKTLELNPNFWVPHRYLGYAAIERGDFPDAIAHFEKARELARGNTAPVSMLGYVAARTGDTEKARAVLIELTTMSTQRYVPPSHIAVIHLALGEPDQALEWLNKAHEERDVQLQFLKVDRRWDPLRSDPRFATLLQRIGLPSL